MSKTTATTKKTVARKPAVNAAARQAARTAKQVAPAKAAKPLARTPSKRAKAITSKNVGAAEVKSATPDAKTPVSSLDANTHQSIEPREKLMNDQVKQFTDLQARTFEPMRLFSALATDAMEQLVRKNYEVMGEIVDFSVKQIQLPAQNEQVSDVAQSKMAETKAFTEQLGNRANEYVELGNQFSVKVREATEVAAASMKAA